MPPKRTQGRSQAPGQAGQGPAATPRPPPRRSRRIAQEAPDVTDALEEVLRSERERKSRGRFNNARDRGLPADLGVVRPRQDPPAISPYSARCDGVNFHDRTQNPHVDKALRLQRILDAPNFANAGDRAFARWFRPGGQTHDLQNHADNVVTRPVIMESWIDAYGQISWDNLVSKSRPGRKYMVNAQVNPKRRAMEVFREDHHTNGPGYYIRWSNVNHVRVNGERGAVVGGENFAFGPLPPFAIIEVEDVVIFWWRNIHALQAVPRDMPPRDGRPGPPNRRGGGDGGGVGGGRGGRTGGDGGDGGERRRPARQPLAPRDPPQPTANWPFG